MRSTPKRICLISMEIFAWGKYGGYGRATRIIGRELVKRGYEVFAVVPRRTNQKEEEVLDGITVLSFSLENILSSGKIYKKINADIYHSCEPTFGTWLAMKNVPSATHIITSRYPRDWADWWVDFSYPSKSRLQVIGNFLYESNFLVGKAVRHADAVFVSAHFLKDIVKKVYRYKAEIGFLPTPTAVPTDIVKSPQASVLYMARLDPRKRPELSLSLAEKFPDVTFHVAGKARVPAYEDHLKKTYGHLPNVFFHGFLNQFEGKLHDQLSSEAWIHINTAVIEGMPNSILEAAAHKCAILSHVNPDGFASKFGYHVTGTDFAEGLHKLLDHDDWKQKGERGYDYVRNTFDIPVAMHAHEEAYHKTFSKKS